MPRHPKGSITRAIRTRRPLHPGRDADELEALTWPGATMRVKNWMTRAPARVHADALVRGTADMLKTRRLRHLPVVDRGTDLAIRSWRVRGAYGCVLSRRDEEEDAS